MKYMVKGRDFCLDLWGHRRYAKANGDDDQGSITRPVPMVCHKTVAKGDGTSAYYEGSY